jgi:hypothetical protein
MTRFAPLAVVALALTTSVALAAQAAAPQSVPGTIDEVTVYRGQALVTRLVDVPGPAGPREVVVGGLPERIQPGSIYAEGAGGITVNSVSFSVRPVEKDVRADVQKYDDQIRALQDKISANQRKTQLNQSNKDYLAKLETFTAATSNVELSKGVLNADTLVKLTQFQFEQRQVLSDSDMKLALEQRDLNEQLQTLQRARSQVAGSSSKLEREAKVSLTLTGNGGKMRLRYVVDNATWLPSYNVRHATANSKAITIEYLASIQQLTGEDWSNVQISLSTATPSLVAKAPVLNQLAITASRGGQPTDVLAQIQQAGTTQARQNLQEQRQQLENFRGTIGNNAYNGNAILNAGQQAANTVNINGTVVNLDYIGDNNDIDLILNKTAADLQLVDLLAQEKIARTKEKPAPLTPDEGLAVTYNINPRTTLLSRSDRQLIQIAPATLTAEVYKVASPVLSTFVYDEATATNTSDTVFLWGDVSTYVNNEFVGRGVMPSVAIGQRFGAGLGIDSSLRTRRELVEKTENTQGGNRVVEFTYRLTVENFGANAAAIHLLDRLPTAKETDIRVTLTSRDAKDAKQPELSKDPIYEQTDRKKGILRWDLEVPAKAIDDKAVVVEYSFKLEYAANSTIATPSAPPASANPAGGMGGARGGAGGMGGGFGGSGGAGRGAAPGR